MSLDPSWRVFVAGHRGMVGSALVRGLRAAGCDDLLLRSRDELDLTDQARVRSFFAAERPRVVLVAAARVGGILANRDHPADFLYENLVIAGNVIGAAFEHGTRRLVFLGSSCVYPREAPQPIPEDALLTGPLEPTNEAYAVAKIAGIRLCDAIRNQHGRDFTSVMPCNLYGPGDNFDPTGSHVVPGLMRRFHHAAAAGSPEVTVWGSGEPRREFLHVDDLAGAVLRVAGIEGGPGMTNIGAGEDIAVRDLAGLLADVTGFRGRIAFDRGKPDGTPRKLLDVTRIRELGWRPRIPLREGLERTYRWALDHGVFDTAPR